MGAALVIGRPRVGPFLMSEQQTGILSDPSSRKTLLVACLATLTLFPSYQTLRASLLALILAIAELIIFNGGSHPDVDDVMLGAREKPYGARYNAYTTSSTFKSIAMPVFCMTALMSLVLAPTESGGFAAIFALAAVKVVRWASLFLLVRIRELPASGTFFDHLPISYELLLPRLDPRCQHSQSRPRQLPHRHGTSSLWQHS